MEIQSLSEGHFFHIYNRGINREDIFKEEINYPYFLNQYFLYCSQVLETLAYSLLKNHFHLLVFVKENIQVLKRNGEGFVKLNASRQLSHFFNSYTQSVNKAYKRTGPLFESPFKRKIVDDDRYITSLLYYIHHNAQSHGLVNDFKKWPYSSYQHILNNDNGLFNSQKVLDWFGGKVPFEKAHQAGIEKNLIEKYIIE